MKQISNDFKNTLTTFGREYKNIIDVYDNLLLSTQQNDLLLTEDNKEIIAKTSTTDIALQFDDENIYSIKLITKGEILSTLMKELDFESGLNLDKGSIINYKFGLKINNNYEYIDYGKFIIYKKEFNQDTKNYIYTCYDFMLKTMIMIGDEFAFIGTPTGANMIPKICDLLGIDFDDDTEKSGVPTPYGMIKNLTYNINLNVIKNSKITYRDLLNYLCQYFGVSIYMDNNEMKIKLLGDIVQSNNSYIIDNNNVTIVDTINKDFMKDKNVTFKSIYGKINALTITGTEENNQKYIEDTASVETNGLTLFQIEKNIILSDSTIWDTYGDNITNNIFEMIDNVNFELMDIATTGILYLEWLDYYNVIIDNETYKCLLLNSEITIKSGISENIYTDLPEKNVSEYTTSNKSNDIIGDTIRSRGNAYANGERLLQISDLSAIMPIGKVEIFFDNLDHSSYLGFIWQQIGAGKVPVGLDINDTDFDTIGKTGGEKQHTLIIDEMPSHNHTYKIATDGLVQTGGSGSYIKYGYDFPNTSDTGGGQSHNNLQPYIVMAFWKRIG